MDDDDKAALKAIDEIRRYLATALISEGCVSEPCIGCISCNAVELDRKLQALANFIGDLGAD